MSFPFGDDVRTAEGGYTCTCCTPALAGGAMEEPPPRSDTLLCESRDSQSACLTEIPTHDTILDRCKKLRVIGNRCDLGKDKGVLGRLRPPNTPYLLSHHGNSQRDKIQISENKNPITDHPTSDYDGLWCMNR